MFINTRGFTKFGLLFVVILVLLLSACGEIETVDAEDCTYHKMSQPRDYKDSRCLDVSKEAQRAELQIDIGLSTGSMNWVLRDPYGVIQREGYADSHKVVMDEYIIDHPLPGSWILEYRLEDAAGEYSTSWIVQ